MPRVVKTTAVLCALLLLAGCGASDARAIWQDAIKKCATNDLLGPDVFYFGPSNSLGPGTVFQAFATGGTQESHLLNSYVPQPSSVISPDPRSFTCQADKAGKFGVTAEVPLDAVLPVGAAAGGHLKRARTVKVWADELTWVSLLTGPYKAAVTGLPEQNQVRQDITKNGHLVLSRALLVKGLKAELEFSSDVGADVKAAVPSVSGEKDIKLGSSWEGTTKLTITGASAFYIAGELRKWEGGLAAGDIGTLQTGVAGILYRGKR
jgi:hypothetical protein